MWSFNGAEPVNALPNRILLPGGKVRTDSSSFTTEEISGAGWKSVPAKPTVERWQTVAWTGAAWETTDADIEEFRRLTLEGLAKTRHYHEVRHSTLDTSRASQAMISGAWIAVQMSPSTVIDFKGPDGSWVQISKSEVEQIAKDTVQHVQACFTRERQYHEAIMACTTHEEISLVDYSAGWPNQG